MKDNNPLKPTKIESAGEVAAISLNAVPFVGGVLASTALSIIAKRQNRRMEEFFAGLSSNADRHAKPHKHEFHSK